MAQRTINTPREETHQRIADALEDMVDKIVDTSSASNIDYDNTESDLSADKVQGAIDELAEEKVDKAAGKGLSTNDYTNEEKQKNADNASAISDIQDDISQSLTATGNPLTIESSESNLVECTAEIEAVQDLHGYDHPWVGGAGKNKLPMTVEGLKAANGGASTWNGNSKTIGGVAFTILTDSDGNVTGIRCNGQANGFSFYAFDGSITVPSGSKINLNATKNNGNFDCNAINNGTGIGSISGHSAQTADVTLSDTTVTRVSFYFNSSYNDDITIYPMIRLSTETDSSFAPYTNICPISGRSEVAIQRVGKNLINNTATTTTTGGVTYTVNQDKTISCSNTSTGTSNITIISNATLKAGNYILTGCPNGGGMETMRLHAYRTNGGYLGFDIGSGAEFTLENDINDLNVEIRIGSGVNTNGKIFKPMIRLSTDTDSTYEPYAGKTYTIQLGETVYGGTLDVTRGKMVVDKGYVEFDGSSDENWSRLGGSTPWGDYTMYISLNGVKYDDGDTTPNIISNYLRAIPFNPSWASYDAFLSKNPNSDAIYTGIKSITTVADWKTYLASNPLQVVYELATPYTIQLTPQQIRLLKGTNNISCNTGDLSIKYYPDNVLGQLKGDIENEYDERITELEEKANTPTIKQVEINRNAVSTDGSVMFTSLTGHIIVGTSISNDANGDKCVGIPYSMGNVPSLKIMNESTMAVLPNITISGTLYCIKL